MARTSRMLSALLCVAASATLSACGTNEDGPPPERPEDESVDSLVSANTEFALKMYRELATGNGNLLLSPYSISSAMCMTGAGARENTAREIMSALGVTLDRDGMNAAFRMLNDFLLATANRSGQILRIANGLCATGGDTSSDYRKLLADFYDAEAFTGQLEQINTWVREKTDGHIEKILDSLNPNTVCVLLNAIYFRGTWAELFDEDDTQELPFMVSTTERVDVPLMRRNGPYRMIEKEGFKAITIPYAGNRTSMLILLPDAVGGLGALETSLSGDGLATLTAELDATYEREVQLYLPRFSLTGSYDLVPAFKAFGVTEAFNIDAADFHGMGFRKGDVYITQIRHASFIEVNEEGSEAAAVTAVEVATRAAPRFIEFRADHPFMFVIRENATGSVLFMGRVVDPKRVD